MSNSEPLTSVAQADCEITERGKEVWATLTPKERAITELVCEGLRNREIAVRVGTTEQVIKNYLRRIFDKAGVDTRLHLMLFCQHHGIYRA